jgi:hypothetical protein
LAIRSVFSCQKRPRLREAYHHIRAYDEAVGFIGRRAGDGRIGFVVDATEKNVTRVAAASSLLLCQSIPASQAPVYRRQGDGLS